ncbi:MAG: aminoacyl-tRNA hydrolase [Ignavibacteriales bacterium]|nr:aminoacyl-tRNA hydrolase [Ignavibacteriales bacterium]
MALHTPSSVAIERRLHIAPHLSIPISELEFSTSRSGGPGGQNVNKLETRVELRFDIARSPSLTDAQRSTILARLKSRIDTEGVLRIVAQASRSQWSNKQEAIDKLMQLLQEALKPRKARKRTAPTKSARERRLQGKKLLSEKKRARHRPGDE